MKHRIIDVTVVTIGFILSPLSWWNDMVVNIPLAYIFSLPFSVIHKSLFLPSFILGYWLSNLIGFLMLHWGSANLINQKQQNYSITKSIAISILYSLLVVAFVLSGWISPPTELIELINKE